MSLIVDKCYFRKVKFLLLTICYLFIGLFANANDLEMLIGKWKVVKVNNGVICDFKTGNTDVTTELSKEFAGNPDSTRIIAAFTGMAKKYGNYIFNFRKDNMYEEIMNGEVRNALSVYYLMEAEHLIYMRQADSTQDAEQNMRYEFQKDGTLQLEINFNNRRLILDLLKEEETRK